jgi:hypothetical protein
MVFTDGAWGQSGAGASAVLVASSGLRTKYASRLEFRATNNIAEYEGLILGLNKAKAWSKNTIDQNRLPGCGRPSQKGIHGMRAKASQILSNGKSPRAKIQGIHPETYSKIKKCRSRRTGEGCCKQFTNTERNILPSLKVTSNKNSSEGIPNSLAYSM